MNQYIDANSKLPLLQTFNSPNTLKETANAITYGIQIINVNGSVVKSEISTQPSWQNNVSTLMPGTYIIQVVNNKDKSLIGKSTFVKL